MNNKLPCKLVGWDEFYNLSRQLARQIRESAYNADMIVAIGRGGYFPGRILSDMLDIRNLTSFKVEHYQSPTKSHAALVKYPVTANVDRLRILLVDDVSDSGDTFDVAIEHIHQCGPVREIRSATIHHKTISRFKPDYYAEIISQWYWIIYPWAVNEDLSTFIRSMDTKSVDVQYIQKQLFIDYGIKITGQQIEDALTLITAKFPTN